jgi:serine/threonine protein kinase
LCAANGIAKIADFGMCCHASNKQEMKRRCGTAGYAAPETILGDEYGPNVDCFSAGVLLYFVLSGRHPFDGPDHSTKMRKTLSRSLNFRKSLRLECLSKSCKDFMLELTKRDPLRRPTSQDALNKFWLSSGPERYESFWTEEDREIDTALSASDDVCKFSVSTSDVSNMSIDSSATRRVDDHQFFRKVRDISFWTEEAVDAGNAVPATDCQKKSGKTVAEILSDASKTSRATVDMKGPESYQFFCKVRRAHSKPERHTTALTEEDREDGGNIFASLCPQNLLEVYGTYEENAGRRKDGFRYRGREKRTSRKEGRIGTGFADTDILEFKEEREPKAPEGGPVKSIVPYCLRARRRNLLRPD